MEGLLKKGEAIGQDLAKVYAGLGDKEKAFKYLEDDLKAHSGELPHITWHPAFDSLRDYPRYHALLQGMELEPIAGNK